MDFAKNHSSLPEYIHPNLCVFLNSMFKLFKEKALLPVILIFFFTGTELSAQSCYHPYVDSVISLVSLSSLSVFENELTGEIPANIEGESYFQDSGKAKVMLKQGSIFLRNS